MLTFVFWVLSETLQNLIMCGILCQFSCEVLVPTPGELSNRSSSNTDCKFLRFALT